jgi:hypothetical protein
MRLELGYHHPRTLLRQGAGTSVSDALAGSSDDGNAVSEAHGLNYTDPDDWAATG